MPKTIEIHSMSVSKIHGSIEMARKVKNLSSTCLKNERYNHRKTLLMDE